MKKMRLGRLALLALVLAAGVAAAQTFMESTQVVVVEVPVQVIRDGEPVRGLSAADFEVYDGRDRETLTGFEVVDLAQLGPDALEKAELPVSARRHFLVLFDLTFSSPRALVQARGAALKMVEALHPTDLVGVGTWSVRRGPHLVLGFTSDRRQIAAALETLGSPDLLDNQPPDPLRLALVEGQDTNVVSGTAETTASAHKDMMDAEEGEILAALSRMTEEARAVDLKVAVRDMSRSMTDFARIMGGIEGRKNVVWLSEGFDPALLMGGRQVGEVDSGAQASPLDGSSDRRLGDSQSLNEIERMLEELRRADCVVQAVDIAGLRGQGDLGGRKAAGQDVLLNLAKGTGGELYEKTNDLAGEMQQMLRRTGVTYVLSFQPEKVGDPETFHKLRVEVKNQPRGTRVVHRPGWYAPKPYTARSPLEKVMSAASELLGGEEGGPIRTAFLAAPFRAEGGKAYVPVLLEIDGRSLFAGTPAGKLPAEIYVYALDRQGAVHAYVAQTIDLDVAKVGPGLQQSGLKFFGHLDLAPGDYRLRALVRNGATGASTVKSLALTVPTFAEAGPVLLPPFFPEPTGKWLIVREAPRAGRKEVPYPFLLGAEPYVPAAGPVLVPGQESRLALVVYNLGTGAVRVRAKVLAAGGKEMSGGRLKLLEHQAGPPDRLLASYDPPQLPPGAYQLQVTVTDGSGTARTSSTPFVIGTGAPAGPGAETSDNAEKRTP
ncbi:MAG TPA: VWA domain-containing protein [Thermoanaerobaculia bacterium]|nr:VWA domain-containing protein [Thermoanaerobaculia bacterium]